MKWIKLQAKKILGGLCLVLAELLYLVVGAFTFIVVFLGVCYMFLDEVARVLLKDDEDESD